MDRCCPGVAKKISAWLSVAAAGKWPARGVCMSSMMSSLLEHSSLLAWPKIDEGLGPKVGRFSGGCAALEMPSWSAVKSHVRSVLDSGHEVSKDRQSNADGSTASTISPKGSEEDGCSRGFAPGSAEGAKPETGCTCSNSDEAGPVELLSCDDVGSA